MAADFVLSIVAPDREVLDAPVSSVTLPGERGYLGVLPNHEPVVVALKPGLVEYADATGNTHFVSISGGFVEVSPKRVTVLADAAERAGDIDIARAQASLEKAERTLRGEETDMTRAQAVTAVERASARIRAAKNTP